jgi:hypothetical protein
MEKGKPGIDVIRDVLQATSKALPHAALVSSLLQQYHERGFLTKKQLEALLIKARKVKDMPPGKLATLEAIINKMPNRFKSEKPAAAPIYEKSLPLRVVIAAILEKHPTHKQVLLLKAKYDTNTPLTPQEIKDLTGFYRLLVKPGTPSSDGKQG